MDAWSSADAVLVRHEPARLRTALAAIFFSILSFTLPLSGAVPGWGAIVSALAFLATTVASIRLAAGRLARESGEVSADERGVHVGTATVLARGDVAYGFVEPAGDTARVKLFDASHGLRLEVRVRDSADGQALLRALGLDVGQRVAPFFAASPLGGARATAVAATAVVGTWFALEFLFPGYRATTRRMDDILTVARALIPVLMLLTWAALSAVPTLVTVGADGLHVRWMRRKRFIPYRTIVRVVPAFGQLRVVLSDGTTLRIRGQRRSFTPRTRPDHRAMVDRLSTAIEEHLARSRVQEAVAQLPSPQADGAGWLRELEAVQVGVEGSYRRAVVSDETLWRVVDDASLDARMRAGAAVALRKVLDEAGRARLRVVAESTASPKLRVALRAASDAEEKGLAESLESLTADDDDRAQPRRRARGT